jgi:multisubunit Na+/H+ antiporter MnhB subunit
MNARIPFIAAPILMLVYGLIRIVDGFDGERGPGPAWTIGHLVFIVAMVMFLLVFRHLHRLAGRDTLSTVTLVVAAVGAVALVGQFGVDIVSGLLADDHARMAEISRSVHRNQLVSLAIYDVGPYLFYAGQFVLVVQLAVTRRIAGWTPFLLLVDLIMPLVDKDLIPIGAAALLVSFVSISKRIPARPEPALV